MLNVNQSIPILSQCYYQTTSEATVTIVRNDKTQNLDIIVPIRKLMQRYKALIDCSSIGTSLLS